MVVPIVHLRLPSWYLRVTVMVCSAVSYVREQIFDLLFIKIIIFFKCLTSFEDIRLTG